MEKILPTEIVMQATAELNEQVAKELEKEDPVEDTFGELGSKWRIKPNGD